jgi:hypothetical protein
MRKYPSQRSLRCSIAVSAIFYTATVFTATPLFAADSKYQPDPLEPAPEGSVQCSWSKMQRDEYQNCLGKKRFFDGMKPEEKEKYNKEVEKRQTEERIRQLERNQVIYPPYRPK